MLIIGSHAINHWYTIRKSKDVDIIATFSEFQKFCQLMKPEIVKCIPIGTKGNKFVVNTKDSTIYEFEIAWGDDKSASTLLDLAKRDEKLARTEEMHSLPEIIRNHQVVYIATPYLCYWLKMSHRFLKNSPHFAKTMKDINDLRKRFGFSLAVNAPIDSGDFAAWYKQRVEETYDYKHPSLMRSKQDFFDPNIGVKYVFDHDSIHQAVRIGEFPAYTYFKRDDEDVFCDKTKFDALPHSIKLNSVLEESYVLAIERCLLHFFDVTYERAFMIALEKVCTSITSGWWRDYAWNNYDYVVHKFHELNTPTDNFFTTFKRAVTDGKVLPYMPPVPDEHLDKVIDQLKRRYSRSFM